MPQNPMENLQTLLRLRTPQNTTSQDPWLARRQGEIASGLDDFIPDADSNEYVSDQLGDTERQIVRNRVVPGMEHMPITTTSRDSRRSGDMAKLKQVLGIAQQEQEAEIAKSVLGQQAAMDRILAAQGAQTYRTEMQQSGSNARSEADRAAREQALETRLGSVEAQQAARDAAAMERTRYGADAAMARQEAKKPRSWIDIIRGLMPGGEEEVVAPAPAEAPTADPREERRKRYGY
jgi:hypothetical protein